MKRFQKKQIVPSLGTSRWKANPERFQSNLPIAFSGGSNVSRCDKAVGLTMRLRQKRAQYLQVVGSELRDVG